MHASAETKRSVGQKGVLTTGLADVDEIPGRRFQQDVPGLGTDRGYAAHCRKGPGHGRRAEQPEIGRAVAQYDREAGNRTRGQVKADPRRTLQPESSRAIGARQSWVLH